MPSFTVTFELKSFYEDEQFNMSSIAKEEFDSDDLEELFDELNDGDVIENIDDSSVINLDADDSPQEVNIEYVLIHDESGSELYRDEDYDG